MTVRCYTLFATCSRASQVNDFVVGSILVHTRVDAKGYSFLSV